MIEVKNLTRIYGDHIAVDHLDFKITGHTVWGFLGPNGAGKSTTLNMITGCLAPTEGSVKINGYDLFEEPVKAKRCIGYLPEIPPLYTDMTVREYLLFVADAKGLRGEDGQRQTRDAMQLTGLEEMSDRLIIALSKGYKQRVGIAAAILGNPDIVILDEPTVGLDPAQIIGIRELIKRLGETRSVIISSHILSEIEEVCENVLILSHGHLVANDSMESLREKLGQSHRLVLTVRGQADAVQNLLSQIEGVGGITLLPSREAGTVTLSLETAGDDSVRDRIFIALAQSDPPMIVLSMEKQEADLEEIFLKLTGGTADSEDKEGASL